MINVFFIDEHDSSKQNGIGTFRDQLLPRLGAAAGIKLYLISLNYDLLDIQKNKTAFVIEYKIPLIAQGNWRANGGLICPVLRTYIKDGKNNVFIVNHSPCSSFISSLREAFPNSKVVFVIHDQGWCTPLMGSKDLLKKILVENNTPDNINSDIVKSVKNYCKEEKSIYDAVDAVICLSPSTQEILKTIYKVPNEKIYRIPNGYTDKTTQTYSQLEAKLTIGLNPEEKVLIFAGRPAAYKGIEATLKALNQIKDKHNIRCVFCGNMDGFGKFSDQLLPIAHIVTFTGQLNKEDLYKWYKAADVGLMPSYSEQFGYSAIEMISQGLPLVVSDGNGLCDMFIDGQNAYVAHIGDVTNVNEFAQNLANRIDKVLTAGQEEITRINERAQSNIQNKYAVESMTNSYIKLFHQLTK
ncbi:MAG: glycosyltransferase [Muribaculaceae bacterium]|nr:glycosyltransferase [Muribaculaceae bacterium]